MNVINQLITLSATKFKLANDAIQANDDIFSTLGINSLQAVELLTEIENHFNIEIPDYELKNVRNFYQLAEKIKIRL